MGESILTRASGTAEAIVPVIPGYHVVMVTLKDSTGTPIPGMRVNCKDGTKYFDYLTNDKGKVMFSTNSGSINLYAPVVFPNNTIIMDHRHVYMNNIDCPVGLSSSVDLKLQGYNDGENIRFTQVGNANLYGDCRYSEPPYFVQYGNYVFLATSKIDLSVGGGGGGGGSGSKWYAQDKYHGGSGGELKTLNNININKGYLYNSGLLGLGGDGGKPDNNDGKPTEGRTGGSSMFFNLAAIGGNGGRGLHSPVVSPNNGWFGNGGVGNAKIRSSNVAYGGGGGSFARFDRSGDPPYEYERIRDDLLWRESNIYFGGYPYGSEGGGVGAGSSYVSGGGTGIYGGGGGGGGGVYADVIDTDWSSSWYWGGNGGSGRIELKLYR